MPVLSTDLRVRLTGGLFNQVPAASIGGTKSGTVAGANLFEAVPAAEATAGSTKYRCVCLHNAHATLAAQNLKVWITSNTPSATTTVEIGLGTSAINGNDPAIANETTAPAGVTFSAPSTEAAALAVGTLLATQHRTLWIKRIVNAGTAASASDPVTLGLRCDSLA